MYNMFVQSIVWVTLRTYKHQYLNCISRCKVVIYKISSFISSVWCSLWTIDSSWPYYILQMNNKNKMFRFRAKWEYIVCTYYNLYATFFRGWNILLFIFFTKKKKRTEHFFLVCERVQHEIMLKQVSVIV